jgi:hypothetical protein
VADGIVVRAETDVRAIVDMAEIAAGMAVVVAVDRVAGAIVGLAADRAN